MAKGQEKRTTSIAIRGLVVLSALGLVLSSTLVATQESRSSGNTDEEAMGPLCEPAAVKDRVEALVRLLHGTDGERTFVRRCFESGFASFRPAILRYCKFHGSPHRDAAAAILSSRYVTFRRECDQEALELARLLTNSTPLEKRVQVMEPVRERLCWKPRETADLLAVVLADTPSLTDAQRGCLRGQAALLGLRLEQECQSGWRGVDPLRAVAVVGRQACGIVGELSDATLWTAAAGNR